MRWRDMLAGLVLLLSVTSACEAQPWLPFLPRDRGIDWSDTGVGTIPARPLRCASLQTTATVAQINSALAACPSGQSVYLEPGTFAISGTIHVPSNVTLRGAGADQTILNATGSGEAVIALGSGDVPFRPRILRPTASAGAAQLQLVSAAGIIPGSYLAIAERNDSAYVTSAGSGGNCNWCDGGWSKDGSLARGQIVQVTAVSGNSVLISPALYTAYTQKPIAVPFEMAAVSAGVEDLQVRANDTGYAANFLLDMCARCWLRGVESNYADGDHVSIRWGYRDEVRDSYFSNAYLHVPGAHDSDIQVALKTSASRVENNIIERTHEAVMLEWGAAGNVIAYNYTLGEFDSDAPNVVIGGVDCHGAHPQFNLLEGNVLTAIYADSVWGSSSDTTAFRNWVIGTNRVCPPLHGRGPVDCRAPSGHDGFQAARAVQFSYTSSRNNVIGNVIGRAQKLSPGGDSLAFPQVDTLEYPQMRPYEAAAGITFGYGSANDDGSGDGCGGGKPPCHAANNAASDVLHGNVIHTGGRIVWLPSLSHSLPPSFYLAREPAWWGNLPFPAIGPDVTGGPAPGGPAPGGHGYGNPAQACYLRVMRGSDGGTGSPLAFNAYRCYGRASPPGERSTTSPKDVDGPK